MSAVTLKELFPGAYFDSENGTMVFPISSLNGFHKNEAFDSESDSGELVRAIFERVYESYKSLPDEKKPQNISVNRIARTLIPNTDDISVTYQSIFRLRPVEYNVAPEMGSSNEAPNREGGRGE